RQIELSAQARQQAIEQQTATDQHQLEKVTNELKAAKSTIAEQKGQIDAAVQDAKQAREQLEIQNTGASLALKKISDKIQQLTNSDKAKEGVINTLQSKLSQSEQTILQFENSKNPNQPIATPQKAPTKIVRDEKSYEQEITQLRQQLEQSTESNEAA